MSKSSSNGGAAILGFLALLGCVYGGFAIAQKEANPLKWKFGGSNSSTSDTEKIAFDNPLVVSKASSSGIILVSEDPVNDNQKTISYSFSPAQSSGDIVISLTCPTDQTIKAADYISYSLDKSNKTITLTCVQAFPKQLLIKIYLSDSPTVYASATLDYQQKISSADLAISIKDSAPISLTAHTTLSIGTIPASIEIDAKNVSLTSSFASTVATQVNNYLSTVEADKSILRNSSIADGTKLGDLMYCDPGAVRFSYDSRYLVNDDSTVTASPISSTVEQMPLATSGGSLNSFFDVNFDTMDFLNSIYPYLTPKTSEDVATKTGVTFTSDQLLGFANIFRSKSIVTSSIPFSYLQIVFNSSNANVTGSLKINSTVYSANFALEISSISSTSFSISSTALVF